MSFQRILPALLIAAAISFPAHAQKKAIGKRKPAQKKERTAKASTRSSEGARSMSISYGSPSWNGDSRKIDSAYLVLRDKKTGKLVQIQLEESEPDSSQFVGKFSITHGNEQVSPEIFVPPPELRNPEQDGKKLIEMIQANKVDVKPVVWKKTDSGQPLIDVYDNQEQAAAAEAAYREEEKLSADMKKKKLLKPIPSEQALEAARQAEHKAALDKMALDAAKREADRVRMEQIEKQKAEERAKAAKAMSEQERAARAARAKAAAEEAMAFYTAGKYPQAEAKFKQAVELDPQNTSYYFRYGITLYRNNKFNEALVAMKLAKVDPASELEKQYYMGLIHYRLKELDPALANFQSVAKSPDPNMGPSATFYAGVIYFAQEKYELAKKAFEDVIDNSQDPRLDEQAEQYLDQIANAMAFKKMRENKFTFTGVVGASYDSNVLLSPDSAGDQGTTTDSKDFRLLTSGDLEYRPVFSQHHEFSTKVNANLTNSLKDESAVADPWVYGISLPYSYKGTLGSKGLKFSAKPGYEILYMDPTDTGTKSNILTSYLMTLEATLVNSPSWFSQYSLETRMDDSKTADSIGDDDSDAMKYTLKTTQSVFLDKSRKEAIMGSAGIVMNAAKGKNREYMRYELGAMYVRPTKWNASWISGLTIYQLNYDNADEKRTDFNATLMTGVSKPIKEWVTWGLIGTYTKNDSNLTANEYSKYLILTTATFVTNF